MEWFLLVLLSLTFFKIFAWITRSPHTNIPPGPFPLPIIGNLFQVGKKPHQSLARLAKVYGPLMSVKLSGSTTVVISSSTMAKEVLQKHDRSLSSRTVFDALTTYDNHKSSMVWLPVCPQWRNLRRITTVHMFTNQKLDASQDLRQQKLTDLISHVHQNASIGCAVDIGQAAFTTVLNLISNICFSVDLADFDSASVSTFQAAVKGVFWEAVKPNISDYFPVLKFLDVQGIRRGMRNNVRILEEIFDEIIDQKLSLLQSREGKSMNSGDLLDIILDPSHENEIKLQRHEIKALLKDFFVAGTDTTSSIAEWVMAELFHNPSKMRKARQELLEIIGKDGHVEEHDIVRLPYLQAVVKETLRLHPPAPLLVPHKAVADVEIHGFVVPKDAQVLVNAWAIGRDPSIWKDPTCFHPERFLDSEIDYKGQDFELIPFGSGRRICPGLPLAHRIVHLMVGSLVHSFDWKLENGLKLEDLDMEEEFGFTLMKANGLRAIPISLK